jgi:hypothetical protein
MPTFKLNHFQIILISLHNMAIHIFMTKNMTVLDMHTEGNPLMFIHIT